MPARKRQASKRKVQELVKEAVETKKEKLGMRNISVFVKSFPRYCQSHQFRLSTKLCLFWALFYNMESQMVQNSGTKIGFTFMAYHIGANFRLLGTQYFENCTRLPGM